MFSYVEFCLWDAMDDSSNFQRNFSIGEVELESNAIYHKTEYRERRDHYAVFWANAPVTSFDTSRDAFCGVYGGPAEPEAVKAGHCSNSVAHGWAPVGAPTTSTSRWKLGRRRPSSSGWATSRTRWPKSSPPPASSTRPAPRP